MAIETANLENASYFPSHDIAPEEKDAAWCKQFLCAMYMEGTSRKTGNMFYSARNDYQRYRDYGLSRQSVEPYKKWLTGHDDQDKTWVNINWTVPKIGTKYRNILVNKLLGREFNMVCTPIDPLAVDKQSKWYADLKAKMMMGAVADKLNPELRQTIALQKRAGDPEDMEDFQMRSQLGFKTQLALAAELGIKVVFEDNDIIKERKMVIEDQVDWGAGVYKDYVDSSDRVRIRRVNGKQFLCSVCERFDFSDMTWGAELIYMTLSDIAPYFTPEQMKKIADSVAGRNGNPQDVPFNFTFSDYDKYKVLVCDGEWLSRNTDYWKRSYDSLGNYKYRRKRPDKRDGNAYITVAGEAKPKYNKDEIQVVYKGKWIVDTEYVFDWGLATDMKRKESTFKATTLSYHVEALDFDNMTALGITERMIPFIDKYCQTHYKMQNFINRWIPYIVSIDMAALENIPLGKGGKKLSPREVLDMLFQTNILVRRSKNAINGAPEQNRPVEVEATNMAQEITILITELQNAIQGIRDVTGINEVIDATGPADRTNVTAQQQAEAGSNNAIKHLVDADKRLLKSVGESALMRLQNVLRRKPVSGYVHSLGSSTVQFVQVSPEISLHEYAIVLEDKPETELKQALIQQLAIKDQNGLIQPEDYFMIMNMTNLKEIEMKLIDSTKRRMQQQQSQAAATQQQATQGALQLEKEKQNTLILEYKLKGELEDKKGAWYVEANKARSGGILDQESISAIKEVFMQVMQHEHEKGMAAAPGGPATGAGPAGPQPDQQSPQAPEEQTVPESLQE